MISNIKADNNRLIMEFKEHLKKNIDLELSNEKLDKLSQFYFDMVEMNKVVNLTAITKMEEAARKHFADSLELYRAVPDIAEKSYKIIDIGTGAGFPGIPLAIVYTNCKFVLTDSLGKRLKFIDTEIERLKLDNVITVHARAEDLGHDIKYRECFDIAVSRAVANLSTLSEYSLPFVHKGGYFIPYKSGDVDEELENAKRAIKLLGGKMQEIIRFSLAGERDLRTLIKIKKMENTSKSYPRKAGTPSKEPL